MIRAVTGSDTYSFGDNKRQVDSPMIYSRIRFQPITKAMSSPTVT